VKPVTVSATVPKSSQDVYEFLEVLANHELFMDRMFIDWRFSGPERGVGAQARAKASAPGSQEWTEFEIIEAAPRRIVAEAINAGGKRRIRSTYLLEDLPDGRTRISLEFAWLEAPRLERLGTPLARAFVRRANGSAMRRLAKRLAQR
jgi:hypothetical protein